MADTLLRHCTSDHHLNSTHIANSTLSRQGYTMRRPRIKKLSKLQLLQEDFRSKLLHEKEQKLNALLDRRIRENALPKRGSVREFFLNRRMLANPTKVGERNGVTLPPIQPNSRYENARSNRKFVDQEGKPNTKEVRKVYPHGHSKQNNLRPPSGDTKDLEAEEPQSELVKLRKGRRKAVVENKGAQAKIEHGRLSTLQQEEDPNANIVRMHPKKMRPEQPVYKRATKTSLEASNGSVEHDAQVVESSWCTKTELSTSLVKIKELSRRKTEELLLERSKTATEFNVSQPSPRGDSQKLDEMRKLEMELRATISRERKKLFALKQRKEKIQGETVSTANDGESTRQEVQRKRPSPKATAKQSTKMGGEFPGLESESVGSNAVLTTMRLETCSNCGRSFAKQRISKHENACRKATARKKKPFDARKKRAEGTEMEKYLDNGKKTTEQPAKEKKNDAWRMKHDHFIQTIRYAKGLQDKPPAPLTNPDYIECSYCRRKFKPAVAQRHIPKCKETRCRPRPPKR